jgi:hypothetical protein
LNAANIVVAAAAVPAGLVEAGHGFVMFFRQLFVLGEDLRREAAFGIVELHERRGLEVAAAVARAGREPIHEIGGAEDAGHGVVVGLGDGVELVIVAAGAADGETEEGAGGGIDLVVDNIHAVLFLVGFAEFVSAEGEEAGADDVVAFGVGVSGGEEIAGDLGADEFIVGFVAVEGVDDPIAVLPGDGEGEVAATAGRIGVAGDVEPVAAPALAEARRGEQAVDGLGESVRRAVLLKGVEFFGRGEQAGEVERGAAQQRGAIGQRGGRDALGVEAGEHEGIDGRAGAFDSGRLGAGGGAVRPLLAGGGQVDLPLLHHGPRARIRGAHLDPFFEVGDDGFGQFAAGRHLAAFVFDGGEELRMVRIAGDDGGPGVAAAADGVAGIDGEAAGDTGAGVAGVAALGQDRADLRFEEFRFSGSELSVGGERGRESGEQQEGRFHGVDNSDAGSGQYIRPAAFPLTRLVPESSAGHGPSRGVFHHDGGGGDEE